MRRSLLIIVASGLALGCHRAPSAGNEAFRPMQVGDTVPAYAMPTLQGDTVRIAASGPVTLVNVWATWCTSCAEEMKDLAQMDSSYRSRGLRVVGISVDQTGAASVQRFVKDAGIRFTVLHDPTGLIESRYGVVTVPTTYLIGANGRVRWEHAGNIAPVMTALRAETDSALTAP